MDITNRSISTVRIVQLIGCLVLGGGLVIFAAGCSGAGSNDGGNGDGEEPTAPAAPSNLTASSGDSQIGLDWNAVSGADTYNVYRSTSSTSGVSGTPLKTGVGGAKFTDSSANNGTKYYYRVTAVGSGGAESGASNEVAKTPFAEPDRP